MALDNLTGHLSSGPHSESGYALIGFDNDNDGAGQLSERSCVAPSTRIEVGLEIGYRSDGRPIPKIHRIGFDRCDF
jgi:hypothetical protein